MGPVGRGGHYGRTFAANYDEGAAVGYKWFLERGERPLFPFGFGLSYTKFAREGLSVSVDGDAVTASVEERNSGVRAGAATPQFYVSGPEGANIPLRLAAFSRIDLTPGEDRRETVSVDPRLFATFDETARRWRIKGGEYRITAGFDAERREFGAGFTLESRDLPP